MLAPAERRIRIGGFTVRDLMFDRASKLILDGLRLGSRRAVYFANTHFVTACQPLRERLEADPATMILNDGIGVDLAYYMLDRRFFSDNLNGTDFVPRLLQESPVPLRIFLLGASEKAVRGAADAFGAIASVTVAGFCDGYTFWSKQDDVIRDINASGADMLLVALGSPTQEEWIAANFAKLKTPVVLGVGALFDFMSNEMRRAPELVRRLRLEWLFRLAGEPGRLGYRYTIEALTFFWLVLRQDRAWTPLPVPGRAPRAR